MESDLDRCESLVHSEDLDIVFVNETNTLKRCFSYHAAKTWNKLPTDLKNLSISDKVFKHNIQDFINENASFVSKFSSFL